jgi:hypothetical protein
VSVPFVFSGPVPPGWGRVMCARGRTYHALALGTPCVCVCPCLSFTPARQGRVARCVLPAFYTRGWHARDESQINTADFSGQSCSSTFLNICGRWKYYLLLLVEKYYCWWSGKKMICC